MRLRLTLFMMAFCGYLMPLMLPILAPQIAPDLQTTVGAVGMVAGVQFLLAGLSSFVMGSVAHRYPKRALAMGFLVLAIVALVAVGLARDFTAFTAWSLVSSLAYGSLLFFALAAVADYFPPEQRADLSGMITSALFMATLFGVPLGVGLSALSELGWRAAIFSVAGLFALTFVATAGFLPRAPAAVPPAASLDLRPYLALLRGSHSRAFFWLTFLTRFGAGLYMTYIPAYLIAERGFPQAGFALTFAVSGLLAFFTSRLAGRIVGRAGPARMLRGAVLGLIAMVLLMTYVPVTQTTVLATLAVVALGYASGESFRMTALNYLGVTRGEPSQRQHLLGAFSLLLSFGYAVGAITGGFIMMAFRGDIASGFIPILWVAIAAWVASARLIGKVTDPWTPAPPQAARKLA